MYSSAAIITKADAITITFALFYQPYIKWTIGNDIIYVINVIICYCYLHNPKSFPSILAACSVYITNLANYLI